MTDYSYIADNIQKIKDRLANVGGGQSVRILGATKTLSKEVVDYVLDNDLLPFVGENRVQEFVDKYEEKNKDKRHFIGRLQTNKVKYLIGKCALIHSLDSMRLAEEVSVQTAKRGAGKTQCLIEVNAGGEPDKGGVLFESVEKFACEVSKLDNIEIKGVMGVFPIVAEAKELIPLYEKLYRTSEILKKTNPSADVVSAGMSNDFEVAVEYGGSNIIRLGRVIFGERRLV